MSEKYHIFGREERSEENTRQSVVSSLTPLFFFLDGGFDRIFHNKLQVVRRLIFEKLSYGTDALGVVKIIKFLPVDGNDHMANFEHSIPMCTSSRLEITREG